jgi:cell division protein FtsW
VPRVAHNGANGQGTLQFVGDIPTTMPGPVVTAVRGHSDWYVLLAVLGLLFFSLAFVYSASSSFADARTGSTETFFWSHAIRVFAGIAIMLVVARIDYHWLERWSKPLLLVALGLLCYVLLDGARMKGASRWIDIGFISFQPSELAKFALILHLAVMLADKRDYLNDLKFAFLPMLFWVAVVCGLIALQPNLSTAMVIFTLSMTVLFIGRVGLLQLMSVVGIGLVAGGLYAVSAEYRMRRIMSYIGLHSGATADTLASVNYQLHQALIATGSGGFAGVGPGQSHQRHFVPEPFGDFIYAIIAEEYGFLGATALLVVFALIAWRGIIVARQAPDDLGRIAAGGIALTIGFYALVNAGVTTGLLPTTGLPMPFISYGGSSVLISAAAVGILLNISQHANVMPREKG